jgi:hypothetical protein
MNYSQDIIWIMIRGEIMVNNNLNINLNSMDPLNSINYKSNQHQESFPYEYNKIQLKMLQRDGVVMVEMKVPVMEMMTMMIPMKSGTMMMTMATISPLREGISPVDFSLPESFFSLVFSAPQRRLCLTLSPPDLDFWGRSCTRRGEARSGPGPPHTGLARPGGWPRHPGVWAPWLLSTPPPGFRSLLGKYNF